VIEDKSSSAGGGVVSTSSKLWFFFFSSLHKHRKRQVGAIFHTIALLNWPEDHQQASRSITRRGITQDNPKRLKIEYHMAEATSQ